MGSYYQKFNVRIGIVCDTILYESLRPAADFTYLSQANWRCELDGLDLVLIASTWRGIKDDDWYGVGRIGDPMRAQLHELIAEGKRRGIKTVFYSKEDPPNYKVFLDYAKECDFIFTSAVEMVDSYRRDCGHDRVGVLKFCCNPDHDNPIGCMDSEKISGAIFSGSWNVKYPLRCRDLAAILCGVIRAKRNLCIVNRNSFREYSPTYRFPRKFSRFVRPLLPHAELVALHQKYEWSVNVNSVTSSETMFAARCYELLASGCLTMSNFSVGMLQELPEIAIVDTPGFVKTLLARMDDEVSKAMLRRAGVRRAMSGNTCHDRVAQLLTAVGINAELPHPKVAVVIPNADAALETMFRSQNYKDIALVVGDCESDRLDGFDYVAYWETGEKYGDYFIQDLLDVFKYADVDFAVEGDMVYSYTNQTVPGRTLFRVGADAKRGFSIGKTRWSAEEEHQLIKSIHEITVLPKRDPNEYRAPLVVRALACLFDNGLLYTIKRIVRGRCA